MLQSIKKLIVMLLLVTMYTSCNQGPTLQTYYVDNQVNPSFISQDLPTSLLNVQEVDMTEEQRKAYESVDKLNILAFRLTDENKDQYQVELDKVNTILKDPKYQELMRGSTSAGKFMVKFLGESEMSIDEVIILLSSSERGFAVIRGLGDNMNAAELMKLSGVLQNADVQEGQLSLLKDFF